MQALPKFAERESLDVAQTTRDVFALLVPLLNQNETLTDSVLRESFKIHKEKMASFIERGQPIQFILPAFPAKSPNRQKTLGPLPDMGEVIALSRLQQLCSDIATVYRGGAQVVICSDGRIFSDIVGLSDQQITEYCQEIDRIVEIMNLYHLSTFHLDSTFSGQSFDAMRETLLDHYGEKPEEIAKKVRGQSEWLRLFNGIHRFLFEDFLVISDGASRSQIRKDTKERAYELMRRSQAWTSFVAERFPEAVRLSIHPQSAGSAKLGIKLVDASDQWTTPWHAVPVFNGIGYQLMKRNQADKISQGLRYFKGRWPFYTCV